MADEILEGGVGAMVARLLACPDLDEVIPRDGAVSRTLHDAVRLSTAQAFQDHDPQALTAVHVALYLLYEQHIRTPPQSLLDNQFHPLVLSLRWELERAWESFELSRLSVDPVHLSSHDDFMSVFDELVTGHPANGHALFSELAETLPADAMVRFFSAEASLNIRFYDVIVLSLVGLQGRVRQEVARNFWDEVGRGVEGEAHTTLFRRVLEQFDLDADPDLTLLNLGWPALAGYNLFLHLALNRRHFFRSIGNLAVTERLDPPHYTRLMQGCQRLSLGDEGTFAYYDTHISVDIDHANGWIENVILPSLDVDPRAATDILIGAQMRLNTCLDYYEFLRHMLAVPGT